MKNGFYVLLILLTFWSGSKSFAAGGPDAYGYTWMSSLDAGGPGYNWIDITTKPGVQTVTGLADDNSAPSMVNIGFNFHFYWADYAQLKVGSNGWLSFDNVSNIASCFPTIPTSGSGENLLAPLMGDLNFTGAGNPGQVKYWSNNIDTFIISYINVPFWMVSAPGWVGSNSFQVILCSADNSVTFQYAALSGFSGNASCQDISVGIENSLGNIGIMVHSDALPPQNYAIRFIYPPVPLISIQDAAPNWNMNIRSRSEFVPLGQSFTLKTDYINRGNADITTILNLQATVSDLTPTTVHTTSGTLPTLAAGDDSLFLFPTTWTPVATGQYSFASNVTNSQDINSGNNTLTTELDVIDICQSSQTLSYVSGNAPSNSVNWNGGANDDGAGVYFEPPYSSYDITSLSFFILANAGNSFIAQIYDDNGPNGSPGTLLYSQTVLSGSVITGAWNTVTLSTPVTINGGGFHAVWIQGGTSIFLGCETTGPKSLRNYEVLDNGWAEYRYSSTQDLCIRAGINNYNSSPTSAFSHTSTAGDFQFNNISTGPFISWNWDFGDGNTSTEQHPSHTYAAAGSYMVCLTTTNTCGIDQQCQTVSFCDAPSASYSQTSNNLNVNFTDLSSGTVDSWTWDFGDGNIATQQNPTHTYAISGVYSVCLITTNSCGDADTTCQYVSVCDAPIAAFSTNNSDLNVTFSDLSAGSVDSWLWDFGDGNISFQQNSSNIYTTAGVYTVCLTTSNSCGDVDSTCQTINVCTTPVATFSSNTTNLSADFTDVSTGSVDSWTWDFGDGNTSAQQNPTHTYAAAGQYTVCLIVSNNCGDADTLCNTITVCVSPSADFNFTTNVSAVTFSDNSTGSVNSWTWDFGDGNTSAQQNPSHTYSSANTYQVCLIVSNDCGEQDTTCQQVSVTTGGLEENGTLIMNAWPNPAETALNVSWSVPVQNATVVVTDLSGRTIWSNTSVNGALLTIDISSFANGYYRLQVLQADHSGSVMFLKQ